MNLETLRKVSCARPYSWLSTFEASTSVRFLTVTSPSTRLMMLPPSCCTLAAFAAEIKKPQPAGPGVQPASVNIWFDNPAGRVGHDDPYQPRGISLLRAACFAWQEEGERGQRPKTDLDPSHRRFPRARRTLKGAAQC